MIYDTKCGIQQSLCSLDFLRDLIWKRVSAGPTHFKPLNEYVILGQLFTNSTGQFMRRYCEVRCQDGHYKKFVAKKTFPDIPDVLTSVEFMQFLLSKMTLSPQNLRVVDVPMKQIPRSFDTCEICKQGWKPDNCVDFVVVEPGRGFYHKDCHRELVLYDSRQVLLQIFNKAGYRQHEVSVTDTGQEITEDNGPWFFVDTEWGRLKVGWSAPIISINWGEIRARNGDRFQDRLIGLFVERVSNNGPVIMGEAYINALKLEDAGEYLRIIFSILEADALEAGALVRGMADMRM